MGVPLGDLDGLIGPLAFDQLDSIVVDPSVLGEFGSQVRREREVGILDGDLCRSLLSNQASYLKSMGRVSICINHLSGYSGWLQMFEPTVILVDFLLLGFVTKLTTYR